MKQSDRGRGRPLTAIEGGAASLGYSPSADQLGQIKLALQP